MKKGMIAVTVVAVLAVAGLVYACEMDGGNEKGEMKGMMMKHGMMMEKTAVATSDGGVVIIMGDHLVKYDRNLKLVNQADLSDGMKKPCCAMMNKMKDDGMDKGKVESKSTTEDEHKAHH